MSKRRRALIAALSIGLVINIMGAVSAALHGNGLAGFINGAGIGCWIFNITVVVKRGKQREHRSAARDRDDSDLSTFVTTNFATGGTITGTFAPGSFSASLIQKGVRIGQPTVDESIKESTSEVPILAYKVARLRWQPNVGPLFAALNGGAFLGPTTTYGIDADAHCFATSIYGYRSTYEKPHGACPSVGCTCGFYACTDLSMLDGGEAILEVELTGRVIVCERGYRAGHQRVIRAHLRGCHFCGKAPTVASFEDGCELRLSCDRHASTSPSVPVEELTALLGVPVDVDSSVRSEVTS